MKTEIPVAELKTRETTIEPSLESIPLNGEYITGQQLVFLRLKVRLRILKLIMRAYKSPVLWIKAMRHMVRLRKNNFGEHSFKKIANFNGDYHMDIYSPPWFSEKFDLFMNSQLNEFKAVKEPMNRFDIVFLSVTDACPLRCDHCYHWLKLNQPGKTNIIEFKNTVNILQDHGVTHIQFSGGEPLLEADKICEVVSSANEGTEFWISTSGFSMDHKKAQKLKAAGVKGVIVSLDHFDPAKHNLFRNYDKAFHWAQTAIRNATEAGLMTALSICVTRDFIGQENLDQYMDLAKAMGVLFVQFLEPKAVGHYENRNVKLSEDQIVLLEQFFHRYNFGKPYRDYPIIMYPGYNQRRAGCRFSGRRSVYIDTQGNVNKCPFCPKSYGKISDDQFDFNLQKMTSDGCVEYG